jgi:hypothetical protein
MFGYGPFETLDDDSRPTGNRTPRWVRVALFGPIALLIVWVLAEAIGLAPSWLFWAVITSLVLGVGSVLIACAYRLCAASASRRLTRRRRTDA